MRLLEVAPMMQENIEITKAELVQVVSRLFALFLLAWAIANITYLPQYLHSAIHHFNRTSLGDGDYWTRFYVLEIASLALRTACLFLAAMIFWKCGPRVAKIFLPADTTPEIDSSTL
jgi:hypothetical protein